MRKYSGSLDLAILCDGIYYLNAYSKYRRGEISFDTLSLYSDSYNWEVSNSGSGALRMRRDDYTVQLGDKKYLLDMHLKYGVKSQVLLRIYFCWDETAKKVIVGYMPDHLATVIKNT